MTVTFGAMAGSKRQGRVLLVVFDDTPGGGLTVVLEMPVAPVQSLASEHSELAS